MKIEKLERRYIGPNTGCGGATFSDVIDKINEIVDVLNGEHAIEEKSEIPTNLDELLDGYFEKLVVPEHQIIFEDTYRKIATDFYRMGQGAEKPMNLDLEIEIEDTRLEFCDEVDGITVEIIARRFYELGRTAK